MTRALVAGGTGVLGRDSVSRWLEQGATMRVTRRSPQCGTTTVAGALALLLTAHAERRKAGTFLDAIAVEPLTPLRRIDEGKGG